MKSNLFSEHRLLLTTESFLSDLQVVVHLSEDVLRDSLAHVQDLYLSMHSRDMRRETQKVAGKLDIRRSDANSLRRISSFFLAQLTDKGAAKADSVSDIISDISDTIELSDDEARSLTTWINGLLSLADDKIRNHRRFIRAAHKGAPFLIRFGTTVDFRAVFDEDYEDTEVSIETYEPKCLGVVPITVVQLKMDTGPIEDLQFEMDMATLDRVIDDLLAVKIQIESASKVVKPGLT